MPYKIIILHIKTHERSPRKWGRPRRENKRVKECTCVCEEVVAGKAKRRVAGLFEIIMQLAALFWLYPPSLPLSLSLSCSSEDENEQRAAAAKDSWEGLTLSKITACPSVSVCGVCGHEQILPFYNYVLSTIVVLVSWGMCVSHTPFVRLF